MKPRWLIAVIPLMFLWIPCAHSGLAVPTRAAVVAGPQQSMALNPGRQIEIKTVGVEKVTGCRLAIQDYKETRDALDQKAKICNELDWVKISRDGELAAAKRLQQMMEDPSADCTKQCKSFIETYAAESAAAAALATVKFTQEKSGCESLPSLSELQISEVAAKGAVCQACGTWPDELLRNGPAQTTPTPVACH